MAGNPRMWGMLLLGLLVGVALLLAAAALVKYLSKSATTAAKAPHPALRPHPRRG